MSEASLFFKTSLADGLFTSTPDGKLFRRPSVWGFWPTREYRLSDEQADRLVTDMRRGLLITMAVVAVTLFIAVAASIPILIAFKANPSEWMSAHPFFHGGVIALCTLVVLALAKGIGNRVCFSSLDTLPSTKVSPWRLGGLKQLKGIASVWAILPNWLLIVFTIAFVIGVLQSAIDGAYFQAMMHLALAASAITALICRIRARRRDARLMNEG